MTGRRWTGSIDARNLNVILQVLRAQEFGDLADIIESRAGDWPQDLRFGVMHILMGAFGAEFSETGPTEFGYNIEKAIDYLNSYDFEPVKLIEEDAWGIWRRLDERSIAAARERTPPAAPTDDVTGDPPR